MEEEKKKLPLYSEKRRQREFLYAALFRAWVETIRAVFSYFGLNDF